MSTFIIDGTIGKDYWGDDDTIISAKKVRDWLSEQNGDITIEVNSGGGSVMEGITIHNLLKDYAKGTVTIVITGMAASIASYLILSGDRVKAHDNAVYMIHNVTNFAIGDHNVMRKTADVLEGLTSLLAKKYAEKTGKNQKEVLKLMNSESWFYGDEILSNGFIDEIVGTDEETTNETELLAVAKETFASTMEFVKLKSTSDENQEAVAFLAKQKPKHTHKVNALNAKLKLRIKEIK